MTKYSVNIELVQYAEAWLRRRIEMKNDNLNNEIKNDQFLKNLKIHYNDVSCDAYEINKECLVS